MQAAAGAGCTGGGDAGTRGSVSSVLQGAEPRPPVLPDAAAATSLGDTSAEIKQDIRDNLTEPDSLISVFPSSSLNISIMGSTGNLSNV